jgi:hypothetical protein
MGTLAFAPRRRTSPKVQSSVTYSVNGSRSTSQGYWSHLDDVDGIAADLDHDALR